MIAGLSTCVPNGYCSPDEPVYLAPDRYKKPSAPATAKTVAAGGAVVKKMQDV